jgi:hypothetical protein
MRHDQRYYISERGRLSGLRATNDAAAHDQARLRRRPERTPMQAVRVFDDRAGELDYAAVAGQERPALGTAKRALCRRQRSQARLAAEQRYLI